MANIVLTNISKLNSAAKFSNYSTDDMGFIRGRYTNEAPVKYLINSIYGECRDTECIIIGITTKEAEAAYQALRKTLKRYCKRKGFKKITIEKISFEAGSFGSVIDNIISKTKKGDRVFIDTTGGFRDSVYLIMTAVRMLEFSGIKLEKAVYSVYNKDNPKFNRIVDITNTYNMFNLINAANSFTSFGNSSELASFFENSHNEDIKDIIAAMNQFSEEVALCRTSKLNGLLKNLNESLQKFQTLSTDKEQEIMFMSILEVIQKKFGAADGRSIDYIDVILWCLDNKMIQQAVTIFVEKMPEFLYESGIVQYLKDSHSNNNFDEYYNRLYNRFLKLKTSGTFSPYPFANYLLQLDNNDGSLYTSIANCRDLTTLGLSLPKEISKGIRNLLRVRNALFDNSSNPMKRRTSEDLLVRLDNNKVSCYVDSGIFLTDAQTPKELFDEVLENNHYVKILQKLDDGSTPCIDNVWHMQDINAIEHLEEVVNENRFYCNVSRGSLDDIKKILRSLIFVKRFIRNSLNHASEDNKVADEYNEYFESKGYNVNSELSVKEIESIIREAVKLIRKITI